MRHTGGRCAWPLWLISEGGRDIALAAAPTAAEAIDVTWSRSMEVEAVRVGIADEGCVRVVRRFATSPMCRPEDPLGRRMLERAAAAVGISMSTALGSNSELAVAARWGTWHVLCGRQGMSLKEAGRQLGGRDHSTVANAVAGVPRKLAAGDAMLAASIDAAMSMLGQ